LFEEHVHESFKVGFEFCLFIARIPLCDKSHIHLHMRVASFPELKHFNPFIQTLLQDIHGRRIYLLFKESVKDICPVPPFEGESNFSLGIGKKKALMVRTFDVFKSLARRFIFSEITVESFGKNEFSGRRVINLDTIAAIIKAIDKVFFAPSPYTLSIDLIDGYRFILGVTDVKKIHTHGLIDKIRIENGLILGNEGPR
jgi:hypothetical protein